MTGRRPLVRSEAHVQRGARAAEALNAAPALLPPDREVGLGLIDAEQPWNPRGVVLPDEYAPERLSSLVNSIRRFGVLQPLLLRRHPAEPGRYQIIAGHRRYYASQYAGLTSVPVYIRDLSDEEAASISIIENTERESLDNVDETFAVFARMSRATGLPSGEVARALKSVLNGGADEHGLVDLLAELSPLGLSAWANRRAKVLLMTGEELDAIRERRLPVSVAEHLTRLKDRPERAALLAQAVSEGWTTVQAQVAVTALLDRSRRAVPDDVQVVRDVSRALRPAALRQLDDARREQLLRVLREVQDILGGS